MLEQSTPLGSQFPGCDLVLAWSPVLRSILIRAFHHAKAGKHSGSLVEHPKSQQGCFGSLLATYLGEEIYRDRKGTTKKGKKDLKRKWEGITRADGKETEKQGEDDKRKDQDPAVSQPLKGQV